MLIALSSTSRNCGASVFGDAGGDTSWAGGRGLERGDIDGDRVRRGGSIAGGGSKGPVRGLGIRGDLSLPSSLCRPRGETRGIVKGVWSPGGFTWSCLSTHCCNAATSIFAILRDPVLGK